VDDLIFRRALIFRCCALIGGLLTPIAGAQTRVPTIGYLAQRSGPSHLDEAFLRGLREHGYVEGKNVIIAYRWGPRADQLPALAIDLVRSKVNVIVSSGYPSNKAAKDATSSIPIVMATSGDAVQEGLVASFARPGGNVTGFSVLNRELSGKRLQVVREAVPGLKRVAALFNGSNPAMPPQFKQTSAAAEQLGLQVSPLDVSFPDGIERSFEEASQAGMQAVMVLSDSATISHRSQISAAAMKYRLPTIFANRDYLKAGGLMSYGPNLADNFRNAAGYVSRILKGANPAEMPVEQPTKFELVINLETAKALGLTLPPTLLLRADEILQ
jgi:putative ABC transport system substrate-binding protein